MPRAVVPETFGEGHAQNPVGGHTTSRRQSREVLVSKMICCSRATAATTGDCKAIAPGDSREVGDGGPVCFLTRDHLAQAKTDTSKAGVLLLCHTHEVRNADAHAIAVAGTRVEGARGLGRLTFGSLAAACDAQRRGRLSGIMTAVCSHGRRCACRHAHGAHAARPGASGLTALLAFVLCIMLGIFARHVNAVGMHPRLRTDAASAFHGIGMHGRPMLASCHDIVQNLTHECVQRIHDELQKMQALDRLHHDSSEMLRQWQHGPPSEASDDEKYVWNRTWTNTRKQKDTMSELSRTVDEQKMALNVGKPKIVAAINECASGVMDIHNPASTNMLRACVMHKVSPDLFPDQPAISFMAQLAEPSRKIEDFIEAAMKCASGQVTSVRSYVALHSMLTSKACAGRVSGHATIPKIHVVVILRAVRLAWYRAVCRVCTQGRDCC